MLICSLMYCSYGFVTFRTAEEARKVQQMVTKVPFYPPHIKPSYLPVIYTCDAVFSIFLFRYNDAQVLFTVNYDYSSLKALLFQF